MMAAVSQRRPSMASPLPNESAIDRYVVTDEEFESLQNFDWSCVSSEILNDLEFITKLPNTPVLDYDALKPLLPPARSDAPSKTLFIDLDETLVHTALGSVPENSADSNRHDLSFISDADGSVQARVFFRPWTTDFLQILSRYYELALYTASVKLYADIIVDELDPDRIITHRLYREHCTQYGESEIYFKDLNGTGRALKDSVVMDNRLISFGLNISNGLFVSSYTGQPNDTELLHLLPILVALSKQDDVRSALTETYKLPVIVQRYRQDVDADVARSLAIIGSPRAHCVDDTSSLHMQAVSKLGSMSESRQAKSGELRETSRDGGVFEETADSSDDGSTATPSPASQRPRNTAIIKLDESESSTEESEEAEAPKAVTSPRPRHSAHKGEEERLSPRSKDRCPESFLRQQSASDSVTSNSTRQASASRHMQALRRISQTRDDVRPTVLQIKLKLTTPERQASLRRLVLPPSSPERKRKQSNPFKSINSSRVAMTTVGRRPLAPKSIYRDKTHKSSRASADSLDVY